MLKQSIINLNALALSLRRTFLKGGKKVDLKAEESLAFLGLLASFPFGFGLLTTR